MTQQELREERERAIRLLNAYESGAIMNLDEVQGVDLTNRHTEDSIDALRAQIAELERRIDGHPDQGARE
jgi:hypothetical protein